ncbi:hypothetical protein AB0K43_12305 [Kitasatospora sp. NPDC049258]|uniref:hypothetical protein n=1 Tax=Kitasatospora sp. NPDC049258 TaxID=3155394 RepID=UPI003442C614
MTTPPPQPPPPPSPAAELPAPPPAAPNPFAYVEPFGAPPAGASAATRNAVIGAVATVLALVLGTVVGWLGHGGSDRGEPVVALPAPRVTVTATATVTAQPTQPSSAAAVEEFKAFVAANGTANQKKAVQHVQKINMPVRLDGISGIVDVFTDLDGDFLADAGTAKLLTEAFAEWKSARNGLVNVFNADGKALANGLF